ncbi:MAG: hypothetical protein R3F11_31020, partial [Verrucomicrobiales bacterium]
MLAALAAGAVLVGSAVYFWKAGERADGSGEAGNRMAAALSPAPPKRMDPEKIRTLQGELNALSAKLAAVAALEFDLKRLGIMLYSFLPHNRVAALLFRAAVFWSALNAAAAPQPPCALVRGKIDRIAD